LLRRSTGQKKPVARDNNNKNNIIIIIIVIIKINNRGLDKALIVRNTTKY
jgi:hypothetical protein